jgi:hypothetical protein
MTNEPTTVFVRLVDEGTQVYRPSPATHISGPVFRLGMPDGYDPDDEQWEFPPGSTVRCEKRTLDGSEVMVAVALSGLRGSP